MTFNPMLGRNPAGEPSAPGPDWPDHLRSQKRPSAPALPSLPQNTLSKVTLSAQDAVELRRMADRVELSAMVQSLAGIVLHDVPDFAVAEQARELLVRAAKLLRGES